MSRPRGAVRSDTEFMSSLPDLFIDGLAVEFRTEFGRGAGYEQLLNLRVECLRSYQADTGALLHDEAPTTRHILAFVEGVLVGAGTLVAEPAPFDEQIIWRLRGLAVREGWRRRGIARALILQRLQLCQPASAWSRVRVGSAERAHLDFGGLRVSTPHVSAESRTAVVLVARRYTQTI